jgi:type IV fimbrial biogenesis protein FimT
MNSIPEILRRGSRERARGFTLVELLAVLAIVAVLAGAATPSMSALMRSVRLTTATNDLLASFAMARSEAVKRKSRVAMCKSSNGVSCASTGGWEQGWIVFHDVDNSGTREAGEQVVQHAQPLSTELRLSVNLNVSRYISYTAGGAAQLSTGAFQAGTITLCNASSRGGEARQIILSSSGRPRVQKTQVASCA